ncbi:hypothetical protein Daura_34135 [Dactylosporangium aurantiacum]|uniref:Uncharacterized protein n=1 Tax=Dactylosporangium aurantiacum TaxID=35754 RepID=A0A9Q9MGK7_9ACTN|nr:hypothetical protein [Dactylosporangium aurantiacum]MDG6105232.1 hypothetical protein [Dactylosporangium aurantiacum]UWZ51746.1 hypothetical protein Daura_34135 [Dactylosporangium aurantiacum]
MTSDEEPETSELHDEGPSTSGSGALILFGVIGVLVIVGFLYSAMTR